MLILSQKAEGVPVPASLASAARAGLWELSLWGCGLFGGTGRMGGSGQPHRRLGPPAHLATGPQLYQRVLQRGIFFPSDVPTYQDIKDYYIT